MKNLVRILLFAGITFTGSLSWSQQYTVKKTSSDQLNKDILEYSKKLFNPLPDFEYNLNSNSLASNYDRISKTLNNDANFRDSLEKKLLENKNNPLVLNELGNYFSGTDDKEKARQYYQRAYNNLSVDYLKDSAMYYSFLAVLKLNLGKEGATADFEHAFQLNPNDSIATVFYPIQLLNSGDFARAKQFCLDLMDKSNEINKPVWYCFFVIADAYSQLNTVMGANTDKELAAIQKTDYDKLFNLQQMNAIYEQNKDDQFMVNTKLMADLLYLTFKLVSFGISEDNTKMKFTKNEIARIREINSDFLAMEGKSQINEYTRLKILGYTNFFLGKNDLALSYFKQSIEVFPMEKLGQNFNPFESYGTMVCIHLLQKQNDEMIDILEKMIKLDETIGPNATRNVNLAKCYLRKGDLKSFAKSASDAYTISESNFEALRLMAHVSYLNNNLQDIDKYIALASNNIASEDDQIILSLQFALYFISIENGSEAHRFIVQARETLPDKPCEWCDEIEKKFLTESK